MDKERYDSLLQSIALDWCMRFPNGCYDENDINKEKYLREVLHNKGFNKEIINEFILNLFGKLY